MKQIKYSVIKWFIVSLICLSLGFYLGKFQQDILNDKLTVKSVDLDIMKQRNSQLEIDLAKTEIASVADQQTIKSLTKSNKLLQDELALANNKIHLYEGIVSPELETTGVKIHSFKITPGVINPTTQEQQWDYELVLMQSQKGRRFIKGSVDIDFTMFTGDDIKQVSLKEFSQDITNSFNFKYFQSIEGSFIAPKDKVIDEMIISLNVNANRSYKAQQLEQHYDWRILTNQGVDDTTELDNIDNNPEYDP